VFEKIGLTATELFVVSGVALPLLRVESYIGGSA
jgi:hypothetical protein